MLWHKVQGAGDLVNIDPFFSSVSLLLHGDGADGSTTFTDSSSNSVSITPLGNAQIDTSVKKFGTGSMLFDGSGDYLNAGNATPLNFGSGDFTVECWANFSSVLGNRGIFSKFEGFPNTTGINLRFAESVSGLRLVVAGTGATLAQNVSFSPSVGTWYHIAYSREVNIHRLFVDGSEVMEVSSNVGDIDTTSDFVVARSQTVSSSDWNGYLDDFRVTKGVARYTASFTPPTTAFPDR